MRRPTTATPRFLALAAITLGACAFLGCASNTADEFRANPTPVADNLSDSEQEILNNIARTNDTNLRAFMNDLGVFWLLDKPSSLRHPRNYNY